LQIVCKKCGDRHDVDLSWRPGEVEALVDSAMGELVAPTQKVDGGETADEGHNVKSEPTEPLLAKVGSTDGLGVAVPPAPTFGNGKD
jgi:hypothetical protein